MFKQNRFINLLAISALALVIGAGCTPKEDEESETEEPSTEFKDLLSSWSETQNSVWAIRLDLPSANHDGTPFTVVFKYPDTTETTCDAVINGSQTSGAYTISNCSVGGSGMANSVGDIFDTGGAGTYTNTGSNLDLCKANTSCTLYE